MRCNGGPQLQARATPQLVEGAGDPGRPARSRPPRTCRCPRGPGRCSATACATPNGSVQLQRQLAAPAEGAARTGAVRAARPPSRSATCRNSRATRSAPCRWSAPAPARARAAPGARSRRCSSSASSAQARVLGAQLEQLLLGLRAELDRAPPSRRRPARAAPRRRARGRSPARRARGRARGRPRAASSSGSSSLVGEELDHAGRVGEVVLALEQPERPRAAREDVQAAVVHAARARRSTSHAQPIGLSSSSESHTIPNSLLGRAAAGLAGSARSSRGSAPRRCAAGRSRSGSATIPSGNSGKSGYAALGHRPASRCGAAATRRSLARREHEVVEDRRRQPRLEQPPVELLQQQVAAVGVHGATPTAPRSGSAVASSVRLIQPNQFASSSSPLTRTSRRPAARAARASSAGANACTSTTPSSAASGSPLLGGAARGAAPIARRHSRRERRPRRASAPARGGRRSARARRRTAACRPARARARTRANARGRSGMWCSTAWPSTRSKLSSANGSCSASAGRGAHLEPEPLARWPRASRASPARCRVHVASPIRPARSRLSVK